jgi:hypothetical protein
VSRVFSKRDSELRKQPAVWRESRQNARQHDQTRRHGPEVIERVQTIIRTPEEALRLTEDIQVLKQAAKLIGSIDALNIMDTWTQGERDTAEEMKRNIVSTLTNWRLYAEARLKREYLIQ